MYPQKVPAAKKVPVDSTPEKVEDHFNPPKSKTRTTFYEGEDKHTNQYATAQRDSFADDIDIETEQVEDEESDDENNKDSF